MTKNQSIRTTVRHAALLNAQHLSATGDYEGARCAFAALGISYASPAQIANLKIATEGN